jgi:hypothetical protein
VSHNSSAIKINDATSSRDRFENKKYFCIHLKKRYSLHTYVLTYNAGVVVYKFRSRRIGSR